MKYVSIRLLDYHETSPPQEVSFFQFTLVLILVYVPTSDQRLLCFSLNIWIVTLQDKKERKKKFKLPSLHHTHKRTLKFCTQKEEQAKSTELPEPKRISISPQRSQVVIFFFLCSNSNLRFHLTISNLNIKGLQWKFCTRNSQTWRKSPSRKWRRRKGRIENLKNWELCPFLLQS